MKEEKSENISRQNVQMTIEDLEKILQLAFDAGRKFAAEVVTKTTCSKFGWKESHAILEAIANREVEQADRGSVAEANRDFIRRVNVKNKKGKKR